MFVKGNLETYVYVCRNFQRIFQASSSLGSASETRKEEHFPRKNNLARALSRKCRECFLSIPLLARRTSPILELRFAHSWSLVKQTLFSASSSPERTFGHARAKQRKALLHRKWEHRFARHPSPRHLARDVRGDATRSSAIETRNRPHAQRAQCNAKHTQFARGTIEAFASEKVRKNKRC